MNSVTSFKICPKCNFPSTSKTECSKCGVQFADIRKSGQPERVPRVRCDEPGCPDESLVRIGKRNVCLTHYPKVDRPVVDPKLSYRARWYAERGLPYEPSSPMCRLSPAIKKVLAPWSAMKGETPREPIAERQPGEDEDYRP